MSILFLKFILVFFNYSLDWIYITTKNKTPFEVNNYSKVIPAPPDPGHSSNV